MAAFVRDISAQSGRVTGLIGAGGAFTAVATGRGTTIATGVATGILTADAGITTATKLQVKVVGHDTIVLLFARNWLRASGGRVTTTSVVVFVNDEYTAGSNLRQRQGHQHQFGGNKTQLTWR